MSSRSENRSTKHVPAVVGVAAFAALAVALVVALGGPLTAGADTSLQAATAGQRAQTTPVTTTLSANPADDLTSATIDLHAGYIIRLM